jgi:hypothetical protein
MNQKISKKAALLILVVLITIGVVGRLLPHVWNTTPVTAILLLATVYLGWRYSFVALFAIMLVSDAFIGFYQWQIMVAVYGSFGLACLVGFFIKRRKSAGTVVAGALLSSVLFFLITNWAVWQFGTMYPLSWQGLCQSYIMALPFFKNSLVGDLFYTSAFFGAIEGLRYLVSGRSAPAYLADHRREMDIVT